jgi:hypothetical protein
MLVCLVKQPTMPKVQLVKQRRYNLLESLTGLDTLINMATRKSRQKNALAPYAKRPPDMYAAIRKLYCRGRTQTRTAKVLDRWTRARGLSSVTRQTVNAHFKVIGEVLWYSWHTHTCGEPRQKDRPYSTCFSEQLYLYPDLHTVRRVWDDNRLRRGLWTNPRFMDGTPVPPPTALLDNEVIRELRRVFGRSRGIDCSTNSKTFYIHWMRARALAGLKRDHPEMTTRERQNALFEVILGETPRYKKPTQREPGGRVPGRNGGRLAVYTEFWR